MTTPYAPIGESSVPIAAAGDRYSLHGYVSDLPFSGGGGITPLPAAGVWTASKVIPTSGLRRMTVEVLYDGDAAAAAGYAEIIPMLSQNATEPLMANDLWVIPGVTDGTITAGALAAGALAAGTTFTQSQAWGRAVYLPLVIQCGGMIAFSNKIRCKFDVDVTGSQWFALQVREAGDTVHPGIINIFVSGGV